jgi:hypothetical protein
VCTSVIRLAQSLVLTKTGITQKTGKKRKKKKWEASKSMIGRREEESWSFLIEVLV